MSMGPTSHAPQHVQIRALMDDAARTRPEIPKIISGCRHAVIMMQQHNMKEENILYPMCDQHLSDELPAVLERLETELCDE
jgi:iron-sulfur cluster repair protein YtfE (RIC family)